MAQTKTAALCFLCGLALASFGCSNDSSTSTATAPSPTTQTDVLTGTVGKPVNGALQSSFGNFAVGQGGGTISVTLTSAVETLPDGSFLSTITMGVAIGTASGSVCTPLANASTVAQAGANAVLSGTLAAGSYCVLVSDVSNQLGPVSYAIAVMHP